MRWVSIWAVLVLFAVQGHGGALNRLFCPTICNPNPEEPLSRCFYNCGFLKYGKYHDGSRCWYFVGTGKIINSKGYCNRGACLKVFTSGYEGSDAQIYCEDTQMKVPFKNHTSVKGGRFNATQATDNEPNETYITKTSDASHQLKFGKKISGGILGMPSTKTHFVEAPGPISESNNGTVVLPTPTTLKDAKTEHEQKAASSGIPSINTSVGIKGITDFTPKKGGPNSEPSQGHPVETRPSVSPETASGPIVVISVTNATHSNNTHAHAESTLPNTESRLPTHAQQPAPATVPVQAHTTNALAMPVQSPALNVPAVTPVPFPITSTPVVETIQHHTSIAPAVPLVQPPTPNVIVALPVKAPFLNASEVGLAQTPTPKVPAVVSVLSSTPNEPVVMPAESPTANLTTAIAALPSTPKAPVVVKVDSPTPNVVLPLQSPSSLGPVSAPTRHLTTSAPAVLPVKSPTPNATVALSVESPTLNVAAVMPPPTVTPNIPAVGQGTPDVPAVRPDLSPSRNVLVVMPAKQPTTNAPTVIPVQPSNLLATVVMPLQQPATSVSAAQSVESPTPMAPVVMQAEHPTANGPAVVPVPSLTLSTSAVEPALPPLQNSSVVVPLENPTLNAPAVAPAIPPFLFSPVAKPVHSPTANAPTVVPAKSSTPMTPPLIPVKSPSSNAHGFMTFQLPTPSEHQVTPIHLPAPKEEMLNAAPKPVFGENEPLYYHLATPHAHRDSNAASSKIPQGAALAQTGGIKVANNMQTAGVSTSGTLSAQKFASIVTGLRNAATKWYFRSTGKSATHQGTSPQRVSVALPHEKPGTDNRFLLQGEKNTTVTTRNETKSASEDTTKPVVTELLLLSTEPPNNFIKNTTTSASHNIVPSYSIIIAPFVIVVCFYLKI